jgi:hypothetical protein
MFARIRGIIRRYKSKKLKRYLFDYVKANNPSQIIDATYKSSVGW